MDVCMKGRGGIQFEVGRTYHVGGEIVTGEWGWHSCATLDQALYYYSAESSVFARTVARGTIRIDDSSLCVRRIASSDIEIVELLSGRFVFPLDDFPHCAYEFVVLENGRLHCTTGPAVKTRNGETCWFFHGVKHREDDEGPAAVGKGFQQWWKNGKMTRKGAPALIVRDAFVWEEHWAEDGKLHCVDGPAVVKRCPRSGEIKSAHFWLWDSPMTESQWRARVERDVE